MTDKKWYKSCDQASITLVTSVPVPPSHKKLKRINEPLHDKRKMVQSRRWCFTLNNYDVLALEHVRSVLKLDKVKYAIFGHEVGESGTSHLQGYVSFTKPARHTAVHKAIPRAHWEVAKGTEQQNYEYCSKDGDYEEFGSRSTQGKRTDLESAIETLKTGTLQKVAEEHPTTYVKYYRGLAQWKLQMDKPYEHMDVRGVWIWGPPGSGKSHAARLKYPHAYIKPQNKWWDGYAGQDAVILDDLDSATLGHYLKIWTDKYATSGETKGGTINLQYKTIVITSNYTPDQLWPDDPIMAQAIKRRCLMNHKQFKDSKVNFRE